MTSRLQSSRTKHEPDVFRESPPHRGVKWSEWFTTCYPVPCRWVRKNHVITKMWANAQRDGRPAQYTWRPLFNGAKFGWRPLLECRAVTLPRRESRWNWKGCPKLANGSQPLVARSSPYYEDMWRRYRCLTSFFPIVDMPQLRRYSPTTLCDGAKMAIFCILYFQRAACSTFQTCILNSH